MKLRYLFMLLYLCPIGYAQAEIYKYVDSQGHVTYSSTPMKGSKKLNLEGLPTIQSPRPHTVGESEEFPRVNAETQRSRDDTRRKILEDELAAEQKQLDEARQNLQTAQDTPQVYHQNGKTFRNVAKYEETVKAAQEEVSLHEKNIEALKTELSQLK